MYFEDKNHFFTYLDIFTNLGIIVRVGSGSQGTVYYNRKNNKVFKIFHQFFEEYDEEYYVRYTKEEFLKFSKIVNDTYKWPIDVVMVGDEVVGYVNDYIIGRSLYEINPLVVNLDNLSLALNKVVRDVKTISDNGVLSYDVMYNIMYGNNGLFVIDHDEYSYSDMDSNMLYLQNAKNFNDGIVSFLVDNYFDEFVLSFSDLNQLYTGREINTCEFLRLFRKHLSEYVGENILTLSDASSCLNKKRKIYSFYQRLI